MLELAAFRFVQEALNNVAKHAQARRVWIKLGVRDQGLIITCGMMGLALILVRNHLPDISAYGRCANGQLHWTVSV